MADLEVLQKQLTDTQDRLKFKSQALQSLGTLSKFQIIELSVDLDNLADEILELENKEIKLSNELQKELEELSNND